MPIEVPTIEQVNTACETAEFKDWEASFKAGQINLLKHEIMALSAVSRGEVFRRAGTLHKPRDVFARNISGHERQGLTREIDGAMVLTPRGAVALQFNVGV